MAKKYLVDLTDEGRTDLKKRLQSGKARARRMYRARILLLADEGKTDREIVRALHVGRSTVERTRMRFVEGGVERALTERSRPGKPRLLNRKQEAYLAALACDPPDGRTRWTMQALADKLIERQIVDSITDETVRKLLKKRYQALTEEGVVSSELHQSHNQVRTPDRSNSTPQALQCARDPTFSVIYHAHAALVRAVAFRILGSVDEADDVAQGVFIRLWQNGGWREIDNPEAFFRVAARREALNVVRTHRKCQMIGKLEAAALTGTKDPDRTLMLTEFWRCVEAVIEKLPPRCSLVSRLVFIDGLKHAEVAELLGIHHKAVAKQVARARRRIRAVVRASDLVSYLEDGVR